jgi:signal transduction histidine kinase
MADIPFKISSGLKNIIGKELITDEFVAVFELVKNSFDADAKKVEIIFENQNDLSKGKIIIKDNGKGMNEGDLKNKWLFVAYSAKKEGTENEEDYRNKIKHNRFFAGAKGVGRFSCDRLGRILKLVTVKNEKFSKIESIEVDWQRFEDKPLIEFKDVNVTYKTLGKSNANGTTLEITGLRDVWDRDKLVKLKKSLAKLINPNQGNDSNNFQIEIIAKTEIPDDKKTSIQYEKVNGFIGNDVFENLKIKTTSLKVAISKDGKTITSIVQDRGDRIYTLKEVNPFGKTLHDISFHLFQLNFNAKVAFKKAMGLESVKYGSVFMYKNGFRVYPFGEPGEDLLLIDNRKQQGYNRFLGTRDIIGRIEINGDNGELRETSSRDGGLVKTKTYLDLLDFFEKYVLVRLENYVVNVIKWGDEKFDDKTGELIHPELWAKDMKIQILEMISGFIKSENIIDIDYDRNFLNIIESKQDKSVDKIIKNISRIAAKSNNPSIVREAARIGKVVKEVKADAEKDKDRAASANAKAQKAEEKLGYIIGQNLFLKNEISDDTKNLESILHHIGLTTNFVKMDLDSLVKAINKNASKEAILNIVKRISAENQKITSFAKYFKKANFNIHSNKVEKDIVSFINEYIENVYKLRKDLKNNRELLKIDITTPPKAKLDVKFNPIDLLIVLDNLISNSAKDEIGAKHIHLKWKEQKNNSIELSFMDDGKGIKEEYLPHIFDFGFTTSRNGSGLGLYHVQELIKKMNGDIKVNTKNLRGSEFLITFKK